jgi:hypothetical protein
MAGYSGTPLAKKLGIVAGARVVTVGAPAHYRALVDPLPPGVTFGSAPDAASDVVHLFTTERSRLAASLASWRATLRPDAVVWVSWPKKSAKVPTDVTEDVIRVEALPLGFVDVKVCAVDETWSGLKLVVRRALRV